MKLRSSLQEQFLRVKKQEKKRQQPKRNNTFFTARDFLWDFNASASRKLILGFWAPWRKTKSQNRRTSFFVNQIFQHKHTNVSPFVSLTVVTCVGPAFGSLFRTTGATIPEPLLQEEKKRGGEFDFICVVVPFFLFFYFCKMSGEILDTGLLFSDTKMIDFRGQAVSFEENCFWFSLCFQNLISQLRHEWHFSGFSTWSPYSFQPFAVST